MCILSVYSLRGWVKLQIDYLQDVLIMVQFSFLRVETHDSYLLSPVCTERDTRRVSEHEDETLKLQEV